MKVAKYHMGAINPSVDVPSPTIAHSPAPDLIKQSEDKPKSEVPVDVRLGRPAPPSQRRPQRNQAEEKRICRPVDSVDLYDTPVVLPQVEITNEAPKRFKAD
ncbi:hypothetical protein ACTXT7_013259 [Hymenolepis weldensis]